MNQCKNCGTSNVDKAKYCMNCGYELPKAIIVQNDESLPVKSKPKQKKKQTTTLLGLVAGVLIMFGIQQFFFNSKSPLFDQVMIQFASEVNKSCPIMIDAETRLDNTMILPGKIFVYNYTLINIESGSLDTTQVKSMLTPTIINSVKTNPIMETVRSLKVTFNYYYKDKNGNYLFQIPVTPEQYE